MTTILRNGVPIEEEDPEDLSEIINYAEAWRTWKRKGSQFTPSHQNPSRFIGTPRRAKHRGQRAGDITIK
jgi:hypothetical protein